MCNTYSLSQLSDQALLDQLAALVATDRQTTAAMLAHIAEVDARKLYLPAACSSMYTYCLQVLRLSDDAAYKRITAARAAHRFPAIFTAVADGRLTLSAVARLAPRLTDANAGDLLAAAAYRTRAGIELLLAEWFPRPNVPANLEPLPSPGPGLAPGRAEPASPAVTRTESLSPRRFALRLTIEQATHDKLERAQALLRHRLPSGDLAQVVDRALDALLAALEREKFAATDRPRAGKVRPTDADPRYVPREVKRAVHERDGERCSFVSAAGDRCAERGFLELDHAVPVARGGQPTCDGMRIMCFGHNQYEADRILGAGFMQERRARAKAAAAAARAGSPGLARATGEADRPSTVGGVDASANGPARESGEADHPSPADQVDASANQPARESGEADRPSTADPVDAIANGPARAHGEADRPPTADQVDAGAKKGQARESGEADRPSTERQVDARATEPARARDGAAAREMEADVLAGLRGLGFRAADARHAVARSALPVAATLEQRLRAALAVLRPTCSTRVAEARPAPRDGFYSWAAVRGRAVANRVSCATRYGRSSSRPTIGDSPGA